MYCNLPNTLLHELPHRKRPLCHIELKMTKYPLYLEIMINKLTLAMYFSGLWEFESITGIDIRNGKKYFHVKWNKDEKTWEPEKNVPAEHIADFINSSIHASV